MKRLRRFTNTPDIYETDLSIPIKQIEKLPLPYTGNKKKLLYQIHGAIEKHRLQFNSVLDAFSWKCVSVFVCLN